MQSTYELLEDLKYSLNFHIDLINPEESEFKRGLSGGLCWVKLYVQWLLDEHWRTTVDKMLK